MIKINTEYLQMAQMEQLLYRELQIVSEQRMSVNTVYIVLCVVDNCRRYASL